MIIHPATFEAGFIKGIELWNAGYTFELISNMADATHRGRGMWAASEALAGWHDVAEREARLTGGMSREAAHAFVRDALRKAK